MDQEKRIERRIEEALRALPERRPSRGFRSRVMAAVGPSTSPVGLPVPAWAPAAALSLVCGWAGLLLLAGGWIAWNHPEPVASLWRDPSSWSSWLQLRLAEGATLLLGMLAAALRAAAGSGPTAVRLAAQWSGAAALSAAFILALARRPAAASWRLK